MFIFDKLGMKFYKAKNTALQKNVSTDPQGLSRLTTWEYKVYMLLREGFSKKECSQRLNMKRGDVNRYVRNIYKKLNVKSAAELIIKFHKQS